MLPSWPGVRLSQGTTTGSTLPSPTMQRILSTGPPGEGVAQTATTASTSATGKRAPGVTSNGSFGPTTRGGSLTDPMHQHRGMGLPIAKQVSDMCATCE
jgi:hypothetical protein